MCPFEFTATPLASPKCRSGGSLKKLGTESNGISGTACWANSVGVIIRIATTRTVFIWPPRVIERLKQPTNTDGLYKRLLELQLESQLNRSGRPASHRRI